MKPAFTNYRILEEIGQGGMATVYLAEHQTLGTKVAIKVLNTALVHQDNIRKRFLAEARNMARMNHAHVIKVTDLIEEGELVAFVMEYIDGETLKAYLDRKGKLNDAEIQSIFIQMLEAVSYVHAQQLVHRDIKPSNFMLDKDGKVKLMDFGIAKMMDATSQEYTHTGTGAQMGTPMYMSPEQIKSTKDVTFQSDIYSLGVVLWQMVAGEKPYNGETLSTFDIQLKIVQEPLALTYTQWDPLIAKATQKNPTDRYSHVKEWMTAIHGLQNHSSRKTDAGTSNQHSNRSAGPIENDNTVVDQSEPVRPAPQPRPAVAKRNKIGWIAGIAGLVLVLSVIAFFVFSANEPEYPVPYLIGENEYMLVKKQSTTQVGRDHFSFVGPYNNGLARAQSINTELWGYVNAAGEWAIRPQFKFAKDFNDDVAFVDNNDGETIAIDIKGMELFSITDKEFSTISNYTNGLCLVYQERSDTFLIDYYEHGYMDKTGALKIPLKYADAGDFSEGLAFVQFRKDDQYGIINTSGVEVVSPRFYSTGIFSDGLAGVRLSDGGLYGYIDKQGQVVISEKYEYVTPFSGGFASVAITDENEVTKWGVIDTKGEWVVEPMYKDLSSVSHGLVAMQNMQDKAGLMKSDGTVLVSCKYPAFFFSKSIFNKKHLELTFYESYQNFILGDDGYEYIKPDYLTELTRKAEEAKTAPFIGVDSTRKTP